MNGRNILKSDFIVAKNVTDAGGSNLTMKITNLVTELRWDDPDEPNAIRRLYLYDRTGELIGTKKPYSFDLDGKKLEGVFCTNICVSCEFMKRYYAETDTTDGFVLAGEWLNPEEMLEFGLSYESEVRFEQVGFGVI